MIKYVHELSLGDLILVLERSNVPEIFIGYSKETRSFWTIKNDKVHERSIVSYAESAYLISVI